MSIWQTPFTPRRFTGFWELRRRKVYRGAVGYAAAGWLLIQVAVTIFPVLGLPPWATRLAVFFILGGFPIALILGWAFDFGPGGIQVAPLLGLIYLGLGRCGEATAEGKRAVELLPKSKDAFDGPILAVTRARISVRCGDYETAPGLLERSVQTPAGVTVQELRHDPVWDPLRTSPRFQKLTNSA